MKWANTMDVDAFSHQFIAWFGMNLNDLKGTFSGSGIQLAGMFVGIQ